MVVAKIVFVKHNICTKRQRVFAYQVFPEQVLLSGRTICLIKILWIHKKVCSVVQCSSQMKRSSMKHSNRLFYEAQQQKRSSLLKVLLICINQVILVSCERLLKGIASSVKCLSMVCSRKFTSLQKGRHNDDKIKKISRFWSLSAFLFFEKCELLL